MGKAGANETDTKDRLGRGVAAIANPVHCGQSDGPAAPSGMASREVGQGIHRGQAITMPDHAVAGGDKRFKVDQARKVAPGALGRRDWNPVEQRQLVVPHDEVVPHDARGANSTASVRVADVEVWIGESWKRKSPERRSCGVGEEAVRGEARRIRSHSLLDRQGMRQGACAMKGAREVRVAGSRAANALLAGGADAEVRPKVFWYRRRPRHLRTVAEACRTRRRTDGDC
jgi:hypothetical protein